MELFLLFLVILNCCLTVAVIFLYKRSQRKLTQRFWKVIYKLREEERLSFGSNPTKAPETISKKTKQLMPEATAIELLDKLAVFEDVLGYTNKNCSLSSLASDLDTNTKYLSHVINTHKNTDFSSYINHLRIQYISNKIEEDEAYQKYKISYLAEQCGFSSHSKFTAIFKKEMGLTPSEFISWSDKSVRHRDFVQ